MAKKKVKEEKKGFFEELWATIKILPQAILFVMIINGLAVASFVVPTGSMENEVMTGDFLFVNKFKYGPSTPQVVPIVNMPLPFYKFPGFWEPEKNDVIVFIYPGRANQIEASEFQYFLKRCIATAGDTLEIKDKYVYINGKKQAMPENVKLGPSNRGIAQFPYQTKWSMDNYGPIRIPKKGDVIELDRNNLPQWRVFILREGHDVTSDLRNVYIDGEKVSSYTVERDYCWGMGDNRDNSDDSRNFGFIPYDNVVGTPIVVYWSWDTNLSFSEIFKKLASTRLSRLGTLID